MIDQIPERHQRRWCNFPVDVRSHGLDMVQGVPFSAKLAYVPNCERPLSAPAVRARLSPEKFPHVGTALAFSPPEMPLLIPLRHIYLSFIGARTGEQYLHHVACACPVRSV
jgi:hypothetical protein